MTEQFRLSKNKTTWKEASWLKGTEKWGRNRSHEWTRGVQGGLSSVSWHSSPGACLSWRQIPRPISMSIDTRSEGMIQGVAELLSMNNILSHVFSLSRWVIGLSCQGDGILCGTVRSVGKLKRVWTLMMPWRGQGPRTREKLKMLVNISASWSMHTHRGLCGYDPFEGLSLVVRVNVAASLSSYGCVTGSSLGPGRLNNVSTWSVFIKILSSLDDHSKLYRTFLCHSHTHSYSAFIGSTFSMRGSLGFSFLLKDTSACRWGRLRSFISYER